MVLKITRVDTMREMFKSARDNLQRDRSLNPVILATREDGQGFLMALADFPSEHEAKRVYMAQLGKHVAGITEAMMLMEAWIVENPEGTIDSVRPREHPNRKEAIIGVALAADHSHAVFGQNIFTRDAHGNIVLNGEPTFEDVDKYKEGMFALLECLLTGEA